MTSTLRWHSCSTSDFPLKRHKVTKACEPCRVKKMRCDGKTPCQRCKSHTDLCAYSTISRAHTKSKLLLLDKTQYFLNNDYKTQYHKTSCPLLLFNAFYLPIQTGSTPSIYDSASQYLLYAPWLRHCTRSNAVAKCLLAISLYPTSRQREAETIYQEVHALFIRSCFPHNTSQEEQHLVELAILVIHYQCMAKGEEQAYLTMRMALDLAQARTLNEHLLKALEAWYIWLTVYLGKPYHSELDLGPCKTNLTCEQQKWAFDVTEVYLDFLKRIVLERKPTDIKVIQNAFGTLFKKLKPPKKHAGTLETPAKVIALCHRMLKVQIFSSAEDVCTEECLEILTLAHSLFTTHSVPQAAVQAVCFASSYCDSSNSPLYTPLVQLLTAYSCADESFKRILNELIPEENRSFGLYDYYEPDRRDRPVLENDDAMLYSYLWMNHSYLEEKKELPLPQPSNTMVKTSWGQQLQRPWSKFFIESEVQTLHYPSTLCEPVLLDEDDVSRFHLRHSSFSDSSGTTSPTSTSSHYPKRMKHSRQSSVDAMAAVVWGFPENTQKQDSKLFDQTQWINTEKENHCWTD